MDAPRTLQILDEGAFTASRRETLSDYDRYLGDNAREYAETISFVAGNLANPEYVAKANPALLVRVSSTLASHSLAFLHANFSAGDSVEALARFFPVVVDRWEAFARFDKAFQASPAHHGAVIAHASLRENFGYFDALRLVCLAYLLGHTELLPRIRDVLDHGNPQRDGLIERLLHPLGLAVDPLPEDSTRELPYRNTFKIFEADAQARPALMHRYLDKWYVNSRRECYHDTHKGTAVFLGYWSFEAGALSVLLDIDDASFRDHAFYPRDMVAYARSLPKPAALRAVDAGAELQRPRAAAGETCPRSGYWFTPAKQGSRRFVDAGQRMPTLGGDYGTTIWQWDDNQAP